MKKVNEKEKDWCLRGVDVERIGGARVFVVMDQWRYDNSKDLQIRHPRLRVRIHVL